MRPATPGIILEESENQARPDPARGGRSDTVDKVIMSRENALHQLLLSLFSADELRRWLRYDTEAHRIVAELPGPTASASALVGAVVELLAKHGLVDRLFFARVRDTRPKRTDEIDQVAGLWLGGTAAPTVTGSPSAQPQAGHGGGIYAPGATFNIGGDLVAGNKTETHHHDRDPSGRKE